MKDKNMTYLGTGVDYSSMDPFKIQAQLAGMDTDYFLDRFGFSSVSWSRGESVFLIKTPPLGYLAFVVEGLGTKNLVADALYEIAKEMQSLTYKSYYDQVAQCNVAMAVNDLITLGALPLVYGQYLAVGNSAWFSDEKRSEDLISGTKIACEKARCTWGGGETPTLKGIVTPNAVDLAGATIGFISSEDRLINPLNIEHGDSIIIIESSGIHANGLTLARNIANKFSDSYLSILSDGSLYGETLLTPTHIYVGLIEDCLNASVNIHYAVNITGHGWRKLMRAMQSFTYIIDKLPNQLPIFDFIQENGPVDDYEAYGNLNMGAGFALYVSESDEEKVLQISSALGFKAYKAGYIEKTDNKKVIIKPKNLIYESDALIVR